MAMDQARVDDWLDRYEALIAIRPTDEATASFHRQQINLLDRELEGIALIDASALLPARAKLARMRRQYDRAINIWQEHARLNPEEAVTATLNIADIRLLKNEVAAARATLETVTGCDRPLYHKIQGKLAEMERLLSASTRYNEALEQFGQGQREAFCGSVLSALDLLHGEAISKHPQVVALVEDLSYGCTDERPEDTAEIPLPDTGDGPDPIAIFAAGFGWSGSGAVFDFLRQHKDAEPFSSQEIGILGSGEGDALKCLDTLIRRPASFHREFSATICHGMLGLSGRGDRGVVFVKQSVSRSLLSVFIGDREKLDKLLTLSRRLARKTIYSLGHGEKSEKLFLNAFAEFFRNTLRLKKNEKTYLLFTNAISGPHIDAMRLLPESSRAVASVRDVRDAYADRYVSGGHWTAETFVKNYKMKRARYEAALKQPGVSGKTFQVSFEDLVLRRDAVEALMLKLGMDVDGLIPDAKVFDSKKSSRNIGVYRMFEDQNAISIIASGLPEYCYDSDLSFLEK